MNGSPQFWRITIGTCVQIVVLLGTVVTFFVTYDRSITETRALTLQNSRDIAALTKSITELNEHGTAYSREQLLGSSQIQELTARSNAHEKSLNDLAPKIERIQTTLEFLISAEGKSRR
jgi:hypothetical protein